MTTKEFTSFIDNINLSELRHDFENVHTYYVGLDSSYTLNVKDTHLFCEFYIYGTNEKEGFNLIDLELKYAELWLNETNKHYLTDNQILQLQKELIKKLKELF